VLAEDRARQMTIQRPSNFWQF